MCRAEVDKVYKHRAELKALGVGMAVLLRENLPSEVKAFREDVWREEPIYVDGSFAMFSALAGGTPNNVNGKYFKTQFVAFQSGKAEADFTMNIQKSLALADGYMDDKHHNNMGQGLMMGGIYVLRKGGEVQWAFHEANVGHTADAADVLEAAKKAAAPKEDASAKEDALAKDGAPAKEDAPAKEESPAKEEVHAEQEASAT